ncbi:hypothetical protein PHLGIDRAFT_33180 [Phlebiopsis gigantea 11061_1 CR5-6]|uniref:Carbohydrate-binding module family 19 domain-containing protein n=1 Tax=Phlebiopsis gigantea (strain 11061_1 CR5-6) TaxID=745531 RepID=A0A0C3SFD8_PHLG1|nr:hypothetical protein PHLGIDRAFT_33180 [Phlebiopsis gigantea 11061_1 CR5-6]
MAHFVVLLATLACSFGVVSSAPVVNSTTLRQNALDAQTLNTEFMQLQVTDSCDSGQIACVNGTSAVCKFGSWRTTDCPDSEQCFAVPSTTGPGTNLICTSQTSATAMFEAAGLDTLFSNGTDTVAFPTTTPQTDAPTTTSSSISQSSSLSSSDGAETVTVTVTIPVVSISTDLPTETRTLDPAEASSILSSLSAQGLVVTAPLSSIPAAATASTTHVGHCQQIKQILSTSSAVPSIASPPEITGYTRRGLVGRSL